MARKKTSPPTVPEVYGMSKQVTVFMWIFFILSLVPPFLAWQLLQWDRPWAAARGFLYALLYLLVAMYLEKIRHLKVELSPLGISGWGREGSRTFLKWGGIALYREDPRMGRGLILSDKDGARKISVHFFVKNYDRVLEKVFEKLRKRMEPLRLPMVFNKPFRSILVGEMGISFRGFFKTKFLSWDEIGKVDWAYFHMSGGRGRISFIRLMLKSGRVIRLFPGSGQTIQMFLVLKKAFGQYGRVSRKAEMVPEMAGGIGKQWLRPLAAGVLLITFPGFFIGKVVHRMGDSVPWAVFGILATVAFLIALLVLLTLHEVQIPPGPTPKNKKRISPVLAIAIVVLGFFATAYFWRFTGNIALERAQKHVKAEGYSKVPWENDPKLLDKDNLVYFLDKATELKSADTLFARNPANPSFDLPFWGKKNQSDFLEHLRLDTRDGKLTEEDVTLGKKLIALHQDSLRWIGKASGAQGVDWGIDYQGLFENPDKFPRVSPCYRFGKLLAVRAVLLARKGETAEAIEDLREGFAIADAMENQKFLVSEMVAVAIRKMMLDSARWVLPRSDARLVKQKLFQPSEDGETLKPYLKSLEWEFFAYHDTFGTMDWGEFISKMKDDWYLPNGPGGSHAIRSLFGFFYWPYVPFDLAVEDGENLGRMKDFGEPFSKRRLIWEGLDKEYKAKNWFYGSLEPPNYFGMHMKVLDGMAYSRVFRAAVESRIYFWQNKKWPSSVADLPGGKDDYLDPFTDGSSLKMVKKEKGVMIYSLGMDGQDDGGKPYEEKADRYDIVWNVEAPPGASPAASKQQ